MGQHKFAHVLQTGVDGLVAQTRQGIVGQNEVHQLGWQRCGLQRCQGARTPPQTSN